MARSKWSCFAILIISLVIFSCNQSHTLYKLDLKQYGIDNDLAFIKKYNFDITNYCDFENWNLELIDNKLIQTELMFKQVYLDMIKHKKILIQPENNIIMFYNVYLGFEEIEVYFFKKFNENVIQLFSDENFTKFDKAMNFAIFKKKIIVKEDGKIFTYRI